MKRVLWIVTFALCSSLWANAQTIADIARRERAKRQDPPRPRIATIEIVGVKPAPPEPPPAKLEPAPPANNMTPAAAAAAPAADGSRQDARDEKWWRTEFDKKRADIRRGENQVAVAQLELNGANRDFLTRAYDPDGRGPAAIASANAKLEAAQAYLQMSKADFAQLEEELRRAGAPAGWAR